MTAFWFWVIVAIAFAVVEVMTVAFFAVFITIGALGAAVVSLLGFGLLVQAIVLGVLGVAGIMIARPFLVQRLHIGRPTLRSGPTAWSASRRSCWSRSLASDSPGTSRSPVSFGRRSPTMAAPSPSIPWLLSPRSAAPR